MAPSPAALWEDCLQDLELLADGLLGTSAAAAASERVSSTLDRLQQQPRSIATWTKLLRDMKVG